MLQWFLLGCLLYEGNFAVVGARNQVSGQVVGERFYGYAAAGMGLEEDFESETTGLYLIWASTPTEQQISKMVKK